MAEWIAPAAWVSIVALIGVIWGLVSRRLDEVEKLCRNTEQAVLGERVRTMEKYLDKVSEWKHKKADPYINDMDNMNRRVEFLERKVLNGHKP